jgi:hypothetical protein
MASYDFNRPLTLIGNKLIKEGNEGIIISIKKFKKTQNWGVYFKNGSFQYYSVKEINNPKHNIILQENSNNDGYSFNINNINNILLIKDKKIIYNIVIQSINHALSQLSLSPEKLAQLQNIKSQIEASPIVEQQPVSKRSRELSQNPVGRQPKRTSRGPSVAGPSVRPPGFSESSSEGPKDSFIPNFSDQSKIIGLHFEKAFKMSPSNKNKYFKGEVISGFSDNWRVKYEDEEEETLTNDDLLDLLKPKKNRLHETVTQVKVRVYDLPEFTNIRANIPNLYFHNLHNGILLPLFIYELVLQLIKKDSEKVKLIYEKLETLIPNTMKRNNSLDINNDIINYYEDKKEPFLIDANASGRSDPILHFKNMKSYFLKLLENTYSKKDMIIKGKTFTINEELIKLLIKYFDNYKIRFKEKFLNNDMPMRYSSNGKCICYLCGKEVHTKKYEIEHILPNTISYITGVINFPLNYSYSHPECNKAKDYYIPTLKYEIPNKVELKNYAIELNELLDNVKQELNLDILNDDIARKIYKQFIQKLPVSAKQIENIKKITDKVYEIAERANKGKQQMQEGGLYQTQTKNIRDITENFVKNLNKKTTQLKISNLTKILQLNNTIKELSKMLMKESNEIKREILKDLLNYIETVYSILNGRRNTYGGNQQVGDKKNYEAFFKFFSLDDSMEDTRTKNYFPNEETYRTLPTIMTVNERIKFYKARLIVLNDFSFQLCNAYNFPNYTAFIVSRYNECVNLNFNDVIS